MSSASLAWTALILTLAAPATTPAPPSAPGPTLAVEDTMRTAVPEVLVRAPRVTLEEILDRVARGEARRDSSIHDQTYILSARLVRNAGDPKAKPQLIAESVVKVFKKKPDRARAIRLRHWELKPDKKDDESISMDWRSDTSEEIVNFAFRPEARRAYRYRIVARDLLGDHLIYRIAFEPKSALDAASPSGIVWVDTNEFVIVRQEVSFERSPVPLLLKSVDRMVIERTREDGVWVLHRVMMRARFTASLPRVGRSLDAGIQFSSYAINRGIPDSVFASRGSK